MLSVMVFAAVAASSASAKLPEWGQCRETASGSGGKYANAGCTQQVKKVYGSYAGAYEWYPLERTAGDISDGQQTSLEYNTKLEQQPTTFTFASGVEIRCARGIGLYAAMPIDGSSVVTDAPEWDFKKCVEPVRLLENYEEEYEEAGECRSFDGFEEEITTHTEYKDGWKTPAEGPTWSGRTEFLAGKKTSMPSVGIVYKTEPGKARFYQQILCEAGEDTSPLSIQLGGHKGDERIVSEVTPLNTMSEAHTVTVRSRGTEALVNTGEWEPVTIAASMYFPEIYIGAEQRQAWEEGYREPNGRYVNDLELKATP
ncbi:MAG TPA: hypothetical protein VMA83_00760 [Solirubrobacteraceae bacterium]|nr:hypothetical protein [Solirubrobacteraceae bacterium]